MTKIQVFILGVILTLTALWPILAPIYYVPLVVSLGVNSLIIFPLAAGILSFGILYIFNGAEITLDLLIEKIKNKRLKKSLMKLFEKGRFLALIGSALLLCPLIIPIVAKACIKKEKNLYFVTILLNITITLTWNCVYVAGWEMIKAIFKIKLSVLA